MMMGRPQEELRELGEEDSPYNYRLSGRVCGEFDQFYELKIFEEFPLRSSHAEESIF